MKDSSKNHGEWQDEDPVGLPHSDRQVLVNLTKYNSR